MSSQNERKNDLQLDAIVVGAGFGGIHMIKSLREAGFSAKIFEAGKTLGGVWYWNSYPGARVDSDLPLYQLTSDEKLWKGWNWKEKFPCSTEIVEYFKYLDKELDLSKDIFYNYNVTSAEFDQKADQWIVRAQPTENASPSDPPRVARARWLFLCTGIGSRPYTPDFPGLSTYKGMFHHTAGWPKEGVDFRGKKVGIIGTGATGVQVIQEVAPDAAHLTVFQRTPNFALPMNQAKVDPKYQENLRALYPTYFRRRHQTFGGFQYDIIPRATFDVPEDERKMIWEDAFLLGGFRFWIANFNDMFTNQEANDAVYAFWRDKVRGRINDPVLKEKLAPTVAPHPFGCKRPSLEQNYYEVFNQPNVTLVDVNEAPIERITPKGVKTGDGKEHEFDILILATGYDAVTGGITQIDVRSTDGVSIGDRWKDGVRTYLGMMVKGYPNMFFTYGPQAPTSFSNGPSCVELQGEWLTDLLKHARDNNITHIEAEAKAEQEWRDYNQKVAETGLWHKAKSWYMGANIPGKKIEQLNFTGGIPTYRTKLEECKKHNYAGMELKTLN
ncbi:hypothetical protein PQX77_004339 [Marasmius sp. AFHP31]|nr:hypothetical protein PQX77_004339 [Marasmius sp. AFHP31]